MPVIPEYLETLIDELSRLPGIGRKSARRIAFHLLHKPKDDAYALAEALRNMVDNVRSCSICHSLSETDPCNICTDESRDRNLICVVEEISDLLAIESTGSYNGLYHVLGGVIDPLSGIGPEALTIQALLERLKGSDVEEIIIATNPTAEGDTTAIYLAKLIRPLGAKVTRIARGLPVGGDLEFADKSTLARALENRVVQD
ncbi:recombination protein RecR [bacterium]|nr:MAG: recombination protein RecR [bacterium]